MHPLVQDAILVSMLQQDMNLMIVRELAVVPLLSGWVRPLTLLISILSDKSCRILFKRGNHLSPNVQLLFFSEATLITLVSYCECSVLLRNRLNARHVQTRQVPLS